MNADMFFFHNCAVSRMLVDSSPYVSDTRKRNEWPAVNDMYRSKKYINKKKHLPKWRLNAYSKTKRKEQRAEYDGMKRTEWNPRGEGTFRQWRLYIFAKTCLYFSFHEKNLWRFILILLILKQFNHIWRLAFILYVYESYCNFSKIFRITCDSTIRIIISHRFSSKRMFCPDLENKHRVRNAYERNSEKSSFVLFESTFFSIFTYFIMCPTNLNFIKCRPFCLRNSIIVCVNWIIIE